MPDIFTAPKEKTKVKTINKTVEEVAESVPKSKIISSRGIHGAPGIFAALVHNPQGFTFSNQEKDELILIFTRRHFATNIPWIIITIISVFAPLLFLLILLLINIQLPSLSLGFTLIIYFFYYLIVFGYAFFNYVDWFYNIGIITQRRMIDIDFLHLTYIDVAITKLSEIEDVIYKQQGFFASFFDYGDIIAHTVTTVKGKEDFIFESIPHPSQVVDVISKLLGDSQ